MFSDEYIHPNLRARMHHIEHIATSGLL